MVNQILLFLDNSYTRFLLYPLIIFNYLRKGRKVSKVKYIDKFKLWLYKIDNISFLSPSPGWAYSYDFLLHELKEISCFKYVPSQGNIVIDIGAGLGEETIVMSKLIGNKGEVYSIEANPKTYQALKYIIEENQLSNVKIYNLAISDKSGTLEITDSQDEDRSYLSDSINSSQYTKALKVKAISLDEFVIENSIKKIDFLRVNIEGAEQLMIQGMNHSLNLIKNISISCHDFRFKNGESEFYKTKELIISFLTKNGFKVTLQNSGNIIKDDYVYAEK